MRCESNCRGLPQRPLCVLARSPTAGAKKKMFKAVRPDPDQLQTECRECFFDRALQGTETNRSTALAAFIVRSFPQGGCCCLIKTALDSESITDNRCS